jgi:plasmid stability protein
MAVLQVRNMDNNLYGALGRRAARENRSISQEVIEIVKRYLALSDAASDGADQEALRLAGSWEDSRSAAEVARELRKARATRRFRGGF